MRTNDIMCGIFETSELVSKSYLDQTVNLSVTSTRGNKYIFILYHYDTNSIHTVRTKSRHTQNITKVFEEVFSLLKEHSEAPNIHIIDNEYSFEMKKASDEAEVKYQLVPPHVHRRNAAERAIRTFKNHLIIGLYLFDTWFPARQ